MAAPELAAQRGRRGQEADGGLRLRLVDHSENLALVPEPER